ncbi:MAG: RNA polymerase subunit sigma [Clostridiales bacterium]|jgi:RNA polymerase sigma factor|nr:RNA polymerase subunit sigma [Clostridiales bacterium]
MRELDSLAMSSKNDPSIYEMIIKEQENAILAYASKVTGRYISKSDDEWSIALLAFTQAIESYDLDKGAFISFYRLLIKRRLIDYFRSQVKYNSEMSVDPILFDTEPEEFEDNLSIRIAVADKVSYREENDLRLEIKAANQVFSEYGFTFYDLTTCSPRAGKTKSSCAKAINYMLENSILKSELHSTKQLPLKIIEKNTKVPRKILERHRKYIIAAIELLSGEYPLLAEYLLYIRKENGK